MTLETEDTGHERVARTQTRPRLEILYEDEDLVAFLKPSGLLTAPDHWDKMRENLMDIVHSRWSPEWFNAHRLDCDTSGVILCAKNWESLKTVSKAFAEHTVQKEYVALVRWAPKEDTGTISLKIRDDPANPGRVLTHKREGRPAETHYEVITRWRGYARIHAHPATGRLHQVRVHLAAIGCPIIADRFYGNERGLFLSDIKPGYKHKDEEERPLMGRLALHAAILSLDHPRTGVRLSIRAPLSHDFEMAIKYLDRYAGSMGISEQP